MKKIVMISNDYPTEDRPVYIFIEKLAAAFAEAGAEVSVISPCFKLKRRLSGASLPPPKAQFETGNGARFSVYRPGYASASDAILGVNTARLSLSLFTAAVYREIRRRGLAPDMLYGHFISMSGLCASAIGDELRVPAFLGYGESSPKQYEMFQKDYLRVRLSKLRGAVAVSGENRRRLLELGILPEDRIRVFPNAVDPNAFHPVDRAAARKALGFPKDAFILAFVGSFIPRKGVNVLEEALNAIPDARGVFIGQGPLAPKSSQALFVGPVPNQILHQYLSAADAFVLPTTNEGCSNAIIEAMACGLPIISSNLPFNDDILTEENSLRVDPTDASAVAGALMKLKHDPLLREELGAGALKTAGRLTIQARARGILSFMTEATNEKEIDKDH